MTDSPDGLEGTIESIVESSELTEEILETEVIKIETEEPVPPADELTEVSESVEPQVNLTYKNRVADFNAKWRKGNYSYVTGKYEAYPSSRISHRDYDTVIPGSTYQVVVSDSNMRMLIRELDANLSFIKTSEVAGGTEVTLSEKTAYVGITLYSPNLKNLTYASYEEMFGNGLVAEFCLISTAQTEELQETTTEETAT